uniref:Enoyl-CoA hydratase domain-containing protein 3, mitochondrial n=1 Tax=Eptatretus burgeri TaxID=7764 RepID=A0A8C4R4S0_EPTBU
PRRKKIQNSCIVCLLERQRKTKQCQQECLLCSERVVLDRHHCYKLKSFPSFCLNLLQVIQLLPQLPVPIVAKVHGLATAAGCQLVASCDVALASENARFATPGLRIGLFCSTPGVALARSVALEMLFTGEPISADDALRHGLVSRVVPLEQLNSAVEKVARQVCEASREVVTLGKATFFQQQSLEIAEAYDLASGVMVDNLALSNGKEGVCAFTEKRQTPFKD